MAPVPGLGLYRLALLAYPRAVREQDGREMLGLYADLVEGAYRTGGRAAAIRTALRVLIRVPTTAIAAHARSFPKRPFAGTMRDIGLAVRVLRGEPHFSVAAIATLALGIGGTTAMFSAINGTLLTPPPFPDPDRLLVAYQTVRSPDNGQTERTRWSYPEFQALRQTVAPVATAFSYTVSGFNLSGAIVPVHVEGETVSPGYFNALGVRAVVGRTFGPADAETVDPLFVLISHRLWNARFGGDSSVVGDAVRLNGVPLTVAGVARRDFHGLSGRADVWILHAMGPVVGYPGHLTDHQHFHSVIARVYDTVGVDVARAAFQRATGIQNEHEDRERWGVEAVSLPRARIDPGMRNMQLLLFGAVALVLGIGAGNLANVMLVRAQSRGREMALRLALGADQWRVMRSLLIEGLMLSVAGGGLGFLIAALLTDPLATITVDSRPTAANNYGALAAFARTALDIRAFVFASAVTVGTGLFVSLWPGLRASRVSPGRAIANRGGTPPGRRRWLEPTSLLIIGEVALSTLVLMTAGLLYASWDRLRTSQSGFDHRDLFQFQVDPGQTLNQPDAAAFLSRVLDAVRTIPGVEHATVDLCTPPLGRCARTPAAIMGLKARPTVERHYVAPDHFRTLEIPLLRGRALSELDRADRMKVTVVSARAAREFWPQRDALGQRVWFTDGAILDPDSAWEVVGVVGDVQYGTPDEPVPPAFYVSFGQFTRSHARVLVRTALPPAELLPALRRALDVVDPNMPISDAAFIGDLRDRSLDKPRVTMALVVGFAAAALALAGVGIYGVIAQHVTHRRREMAVRCAVGATGGQLARSVAGRILVLSVAGLLIGAGVTLAGERILAAVLFGITPTNVMLWAGVAGVILSTGFVAAGVPIVRAWRLDPAWVLRAE